MWQWISRFGKGVVPIAAVAIAACYQNQPPDGAVVPAGTYGGTVVAYPAGYPGYGSPFDYGFYGYGPYGPVYGYSPYAYGYGYSPLSLYGYPYGALYPPIVVRRQAPLGRTLTPRNNGSYGLVPWGSSTHRIAVPRGSVVPGRPIVKGGLQPPPAFAMPSLRGAGQMTHGSFTPPQPPPHPAVHYTPPPRPAQHSGGHRR